MKQTTLPSQCFYHFHDMFYELILLTSTSFSISLFVICFLMYNLCMNDNITVIFFSPVYLLPFITSIVSIKTQI